MSTGRVRFPWLAIALVGTITVAGAIWIAVTRNRPEVSLSAGLQCVENADSDGVDRIEQALRKAGLADQAIVLRCAWLTKYGRYEEALRRLPQELVAGPLRREVLRLAGECLFRLGNLRHAEVALTNLASEFPDDVTAYRLLAAMYYDLGSNGLALKALAETERLAPLDYRPHHLAGMIQLDAENFQEAARQFQLALDQHPPPQIQSAIRHDLAKSLIQIREYRRAIEVLEEDEGSASHAALLAECLWSLGEKSRATNLVDDLLKHDPDNLAALRIQARLLEDRGELDQAITLLKRILAVEPFDIDSRYRFVQLLGLRGLTEERDREQQEYTRYRALQDRLVELNLQASAEPNAIVPRRELVQVCRDLGRKDLAEMWQRAADFCEQRQQPAKSPSAPSSRDR